MDKSRADVRKGWGWWVLVCGGQLWLNILKIGGRILVKYGNCWLE